MRLRPPIRVQKAVHSPGSSVSSATGTRTLGEKATLTPAFEAGTVTTTQFTWVSVHYFQLTYLVYESTNPPNQSIK